MSELPRRSSALEGDYEGTFMLRHSDGSYYMGTDLEGMWFGPFGYAAIVGSKLGADVICESINERMVATRCSGSVEVVHVGP